jgi:hypothetical protein
MSDGEEMEFCDFCGSSQLEGAKSYACEPFTQPVSEDTAMEFVEAWDACVACAHLIDRDDWDGLLQRAKVRVPGWKYLPEDAKRVAEDALRKTHAEFRVRRLKTN